jgi:hypothetical protein
MIRRWCQCVREAAGKCGVFHARQNVAAIAMVAVPAFMLTPATPSFAGETPRWNIIATSNPTNVAANTPRNDVQDVTVNASGGTFTLTIETQGCGGTNTSSPIPYNATASEVQSALEALFCVGAGNVAVTGGPGGVSPYVVTFVGEHANQPVPTMTAASSSLVGAPATATVARAVEGAFAPLLIVSATNVGGSSTDGTTITLGDSLPPGLNATALSGYDAYAAGIALPGQPFFGGAMTCSTPPTLSCSYPGNVDPGDTLVVTITLGVASSGLPASVLNEASVSGGGAPAGASVSTPITIGNTPAGFGPTPGSAMAATSTTQAGAHANVTTAFSMNTRESNRVPADVKDIRFDAPPGLVGSTAGMPRCTMQHVLSQSFENPNACPSDTMVGVATVSLGGGQAGPRGGPETFVSPVYNIAPASGEPAAFAFNAILLPVRLDTSLLSDGNYGVRVAARSVSEAAVVLSTWVTLWGVPADHSGPGAHGETTEFFQSFGGPNPGQSRVPLLTNPQQCSEPLRATMSADSWTQPKPGIFVSQQAPMGTLAGCDRLSLESSFSMLPDTLQSGSPAGYALDLKVPQDASPDGLASPDVKSVKLTLPAGTVISPSAANGLATCSDARFALHSGLPGACPQESEIGNVKIKTPALEETLTGQLYLGQAPCNPCTPEDAREGRMIRLFLQAVGAGEAGVVVKLEGKGRIDQQTGQITITFENNPQLPFSELHVESDGGSSAPLANPRTCGALTSSLDLTPWSSPFTSDSTPSYGFEVNQGCFGSQFSPSFLAGSTNIQAGAYSPFTLSFGRADHDQFLSRLEMRMPPGLLGKLSSVALCKEPEAAEGECGPESLIGHVQALLGPGQNPLSVTGGQVFLTEPYNGAPFGLSIVVPAVAGPYTLAGSTGKGTVVVRATINIDPTDAHLTVKSESLPTTLDGIPLQLKAVNATIDRNEFTFNPTNCAKLAIGGALSSSEGTGASVSTPFQVANCATMPFRPKFTVLTQAGTSKANGASLHVKVTSGPGQANIRKVRVDLPRQLPSRLTTLQKACPDSTFNANPASCPAASLVGTAAAVTPVLKSPLVGPAYLVSHAAAAFPDLVVVLQGEAIRLDLIGNTDIKKGITISTFNAVPDAPVSTFDLVLPEGPHSVLGANLPAKTKGSLCRQTLTMPTLITGQNGAVIKQTIRIAVSGCPKHKARKAAGPKRAKRKR